jgi:L-ascorbate metabolism protein UlaG (beta-lactamase superfamily)
VGIRANVLDERREVPPTMRTGPFGQITMGASDVIELATRIEAGIVLPIHDSTYDFYKERIRELVDRGRDSPFRPDMLSAGESVVYR